MGFFSAVKRFFGQKKAESSTPPEAVPPQPPADTQVAREKELLEPKAESPKPASPGTPQETSEALTVIMPPETDAGAATVNANLQAADSGTSVPVTAEKADGMPEDTAATQEEAELLVRLRQAEPRLSSWLEIVLDRQEETNAQFWARLRFFLRSLEAPENEIEAFVSDFERWLERMEYRHVEEFRSELQYRLALALDLEDEEDERNRLLLKLSQGLSATREHLGRQLDALFAGHAELTDAFWAEMEEMFIMADMGYEASLEIVERLKRRAAQQKVTAASDARKLLVDELDEIFRQPPRIRATNKPEVILMMGVNGAGKTTTIAKLAHRARMEGKKALVVAADTFRAAAIEQLQIWAERAGADFYSKQAGSDPASVAWEAMDYALKNDIDTVFVDTAGRLQTKVNLMDELGKIRQVLAKKQPGAPHRSMLVLDATTGQNALTQAKLFREAAGADEIALTKLDGTAKGGVAIAVAMQEGLPITFIGLGEKMEDLRPFNGRDFAAALLNAA